MRIASVVFKRLCFGNVNDKQTGTVSDPVLAPRFEDRGGSYMGVLIRTPTNSRVRQT
jgi:hypothetical protein